MAELIDLGRRGVHRPREQDGFEHEDHEEQVLQSGGVIEQGFAVPVRPPRHGDHCFDRPESDLRHRVNRLQGHLSQLDTLDPTQVNCSKIRDLKPLLYIVF